MDSQTVGYHLAEIPKGTLGEASKIFEEALEFRDALDQGCHLMALAELADLYGAMSAYLKKQHPSITMTDLAKMNDLTTRAFQSGRRR